MKMPSNPDCDFYRWLGMLAQSAPSVYNREQFMSHVRHYPEPDDHCFSHGKLMTAEYEISTNADVGFGYFGVFFDANGKFLATVIFTSKEED